MNYLDYFSSAKQAVETCVVGSGGFGRSFIAQAKRIPLMNARVAIDVNANVAVESLKSIGIESSQITVCQSPKEALAAWTQGKYIAAADLEIVLDLPIDMVIEATGNPEAGARHCHLAVEAKRHVLLVSKEVDSVIGPWLAYRAQENGKVVTPTDGDQPSLLIGLITWAQTIGLDILSVGKSSEYDFVFDPSTSTISCNGVANHVSGFNELMENRGMSWTDLAKARSEACHMFPQRAVPDLCELLVVANSTGFVPDRADLHAPIARIPEVPDFMALREEGGLFSKNGVLDVFHCLRLPNEASFAGGVFIIVQCEDPETWALLDQKGHILSQDKKRAMLYIPRHLLGLEAATSVLDAVIHGRSSGAKNPAPHLDLFARAVCDLHAGDTLKMGGHHHTIDGVNAELHPAKAFCSGNPAPFYLAANRRLVQDVKKGELISFEHLEIDDASYLYQLRKKQDQHFLV